VARRKAARVKRRAKRHHAERKPNLDELDRFTPGELDKLTLGDFELGKRRSELTPEQRHTAEQIAQDTVKAARLAEERTRMSRELDRLMALEKWGPPPSAPSEKKKTTKKTKKAAAVGRPPEHNYPTIQRIAREVAKKKPVSVKAFFRAVRDQCESEDKPPPGDTLLKKLARPFYKRLKSE
jgi:hypothetical protein